MSALDNKFVIGGTEIGKSFPCYIIAEIGINHNGSVELAKKLIDHAAESGANAVKFQKRDLDELYKHDVLKDPTIESQGLEILLSVLNEVEFKKSEYDEIVSYCKKKSITFLCTPWDRSSVDFLENYDIPAFKIASADMTNFPLLDYICTKKKPIIVSTGMSDMNEIEKTVNFLRNKNANFLLLHCNSTYPSPNELLNLNLIPELEKKFNILVGYSGHEQDIIPSLTAANLGAVLIERHITLDKTMDGIDQSVSLEPDEFKNLINYIRKSEIARGKPIKTMTRGEILQREVLGKSIICKKDIEFGEIFSQENIDVKGPAKGLSPQFFYDLIGKNSKRHMKKGDYLQTEDL